ncbi:hypothetical protein PR048_004893, partial [Dryococelus australis]
MHRQINLPGLKMKQEVATSWNSHHILEVCIPILQPLQAMTVELSCYMYTTMSMVIFIVRGLQYAAKSTNPKTTTGINLQKNLIDVVSRRFGNMEASKISVKCTFLNFRFKKVAFGLDENANAAQQWKTKQIAALIASKQMFTVSAQEITQEPDRVSKEQEVSLWEHFDNKVSYIKTTTTPATTATLTNKQYLEQSFEANKYVYPELYTLAIKYLCVLATSVLSERVFSKVGQLVSDFRSRLISSNVNYILFLN